MKKYHDFKDGQRVYLMDGKRLFSGTITDEHYSENSKFVQIPLENRQYIPVKWDKGMGYGSPGCSSLHTTKESAIEEWYEAELVKLIKTHKRLLNSKK